MAFSDGSEDHESLMTARLRLIFFGVLCLATLRESHALAAVATAMVTVEAVDVRGVRGGARVFAANALEIEIGKPLSHEDLAAGIELARERLMALGIYESVDFALERGAVRGSFRVIATLVRKSATYFGVDAVARRTDEDVAERATRTALFGGTRDLFGTGARLDLEVSRETFSHRNGGSENAWNDDRLHASAYWPDVLDSHAHLGLIGVHAQQPWANSGRFPVGRYENRGATNFQLGAVFAGWRLGLASLNAAFGRARITSGGKSRVDYVSTAAQPDLEQGFRMRGWFSFLSVETVYSEKSRLALVEPGVVARLSFERGYGSGDTEGVEPLTWTASILDTFLVSERHAFTPAAVVDWQRERRQSDLGLTYEFVGTEALVIGFEHAYVRDATLYGNPATLSGRRTQLVLKWGTSSFLASLRLVYGLEGLNLQEQHLSDRARVGEP